MNQNRCLLKRFFPLLSAALLFAASLLAGAQTLYNPALGTLPESQGWTFGVAGPDTETFENNSAFLDTTATASTEAGWSQISAADLNRTNGFTLLFTVQINSETHVSTNRAGFSVIVLGDDKHGIELGFWTGTVFAQSDSPLFTHAEDTSFSTAGFFVNYSLTLLATNYVLRANGASILTGPVRNYTAFSGFPNPYSTPDFIFFGDDTSSASASVNVRSVTLILPPQLTMSVPNVVAWTGVSNQTYTVQASTNLTNWNTVGTAISQNNSFLFTNNSSQLKEFFRTSFP